MYSPESKKLALTRIKEIFETYSDFEHPLTQNDIAEHLDHDYGINIDRKTIGRNISLLKETGKLILPTLSYCSKVLSYE